MLRYIIISAFAVMLVMSVGCSNDSDRLANPAGIDTWNEKSAFPTSEKPHIDLLENRLAQSVHLDIKPGSCPNNLNPKSNGKLSVALLGSSDFDVTEVDVSTLLLEGVAPGKSRIKDSAGPGVAEDDCHCSTGGPDGFEDLFLTFSTSDVCDSVGDLLRGTVMTLELTGIMLDGTSFSGADCIEVVGKPVDPDLFPGSPDQAMEIFMSAYQNMDPGMLQELLHPDFLMLLQQGTIDEFPDLGPTLDLAEELRIHERMFSGQAVTDPNGGLVPGVQGIHFSRFYPMDNWYITAPDDIFPTTLYAPFHVEMVFDRGEQYSALRVEGTVMFYLEQRELNVGGERYFYYKMIGQKDLTDTGLKVEGMSWGSAKALFR